MDREKDLKLILQTESDISKLEMKKILLGNEYLKKYCPFKKGDRVFIEHDYGTCRGIIFKIDFDSHSNIEGLARIGVSPINLKGLRIENRSGMFFSEVKSISKL